MRSNGAVSGKAATGAAESVERGSRRRSRRRVASGLGGRERAPAAGPSTWSPRRSSSGRSTSTSRTGSPSRKTGSPSGSARQPALDRAQHQVALGHERPADADQAGRGRCPPTARRAPCRTRPRGRRRALADGCWRKRSPGQIRASITRGLVLLGRMAGVRELTRRRAHRWLRDRGTDRPRRHGNGVPGARTSRRASCRAQAHVGCPPRRALRDRGAAAVAARPPWHRPHRGSLRTRADGAYTIVMELVEGTDLGAHLWDRGTPGLPVLDVLAGTSQACEAVRYLHDQQIVHADIKPGNLVLGRGARGARRLRGGPADGQRGPPPRARRASWRRRCSRVRRPPRAATSTALRPRSGA